MHPSFHSSRQQHSLRASYVPGASLGTGVIAVNETDVVPALKEKMVIAQVTEHAEYSGKESTGMRQHEAKEAHRPGSPEATWEGESELFRKSTCEGKWEQSSSPGTFQNHPPWSPADEAGKVHGVQGGHFSERGLSWYWSWPLTEDSILKGQNLQDAPLQAEGLIVQARRCTDMSSV